MVRIVGLSKQWIIRTHFVWAGDAAGTGQRYRMVPFRPALCGEEVIIAILVVEMRTLRQTNRCSAENVHRLPNQAPFGLGEFLEEDPRESPTIQCSLPNLTHQPFAAIGVMIERRIESTAVEVNWIGPRSVDVRRSDEIIAHVFEWTRVTFDIGINEPESAVRITQGWRPHASRVRIPSHIDLGLPCERVASEFPLAQVL